MIKGRLALGMDFGGTNARVALVSSKAKILDRITCASEEVKSPALFIPRAVEMVRDLLRRNHLKKSQIRGLGMGIPGSVDPVRGLVHFLPNLPYWKNVHLASSISKRLKIPVQIDNDANAMAQGEFLFGAARGAKDAVFLTLGTGVGGGILIDGRLHHGNNFSACEIGHIRHGQNRIRCACGSSSCIETEIGNRHLLRRAERDLRQGKSGLLKKLVEKSPEQKLKLEMITQAARRGDRYAKAFWQNVGATLGDFLGLNSCLRVR